MKNKILYLTNNDNTMDVYDWLCQHENEVILEQNPVKLEQIKEYCPDYIISYNYSYIIPEKIIEYVSGKIINLHISLLPWNRGSSPNFWSFIDDTPKGVTIHYINKGLDKGNILIQKECFFDEKNETFESTYNQLSEQIKMLLYSNWDKIKSGDIVAKPQIGIGSYHNTIELKEILKKVEFKWTDNIQQVKNKIINLDNLNGNEK